MSGVLCEDCQGYFQTSEHPCGAKLAKEVEKLNLALMERDTRPDYERGEMDGQDAMMRHLVKMDEENNSAMANAVRSSPLYQTKVQVLAQVAEWLEVAGFSLGETFDVDAAKACFNSLALLQKRCELFAKDAAKEG